MGSRTVRLAFAAAVLVLVGGCVAYGVDPFNTDSSLHDAHKHYTRLVRWSEFDRASLYVAPDQREAWLVLAGRLGGLRFTDYEVREWEEDDAGQEAMVRVLYHAYLQDSATTLAFEEQQFWYRDMETQEWRVRTVLEESSPASHG